MKYKLLAAAMVLLIATPSVVFSQKMSPIVVETGKPVPSKVRSGEPFEITYRAKYTDTVLIVEEHMQLGSLALVPNKEGSKPDSSEAGNAEVINIKIGEIHRLGSDEEGFFNVQDFTYTFRIIDELKGEYKIPSFNFIWVEKRAGTTNDEATEKSELMEFPTKEVGISYVSSIVKPPPLDVRDDINLLSPKWSGYELRNWGYAAIAITVVMMLWVSKNFFKQPKTQKSGDKNSDKLGAVEAATDSGIAISSKEARKKILKDLKGLLENNDLKEASFDTERKVYIFLRDFLMIELFGDPIRAKDSDTPSELFSRFSTLEARDWGEVDSNYQPLCFLANKMKNYYEDLELGQPVHFENPELEIRGLIGLVEEVGFKNRFWRAFLKFLRISNE